MPTTLATEAITALVQPSTPQALRLAAIAAADRFHTAAVDDAMLADFGSQTPAVYRQVVASLVVRPASAARLLARLESGDTPPLQLSDPQWQRLADCTDNAAERVAALRETASQKIGSRSWPATRRRWPSLVTSLPAAKSSEASAAAATGSVTSASTWAPTSPTPA